MQPGLKSVFRLAANKVIASSVVLVSLGMPVPAAARSKHHLRFWIPFTEAAGVAGAGFELITPAAPTLYTLSFNILNLVATHVAIDNAGLEVAAALFTATGANAGNYLAVIECDVVLGTTGGVLDLQVAQKVSDAGATTFLAGGWVEDTIVS